jgi:hypothetical protein
MFEQLISAGRTQRESTGLVPANKLHFMPKGHTRSNREMLYFYAFQRYRGALESESTCINRQEGDSPIIDVLHEAGIVCHPATAVCFKFADRSHELAIIATNWRPSERASIERLLSDADSILLKNLREEKQL